MSATLTAQELLDLPLTHAVISVSEGDEVMGEGRVSSVEERDEKVWIAFGPNGNGHLHVCFLISECSIERLMGGEILIQEGDCRATIYPA